MNILLITGGSKGIGKAIAEKYTHKKYTVFSFSRSIENDEKYNEISIDLTDASKTETVFLGVLNNFEVSKISSITLINNAGRLGKISQLGNLENLDIQKSILLNTTIPLILSNIFIKTTKNWNCNKQIISISSGAAANPYEGWSVYCASKSALDMMTKTIALEQENLQNGVKCTAIYPGVVNTNMQTNIRKTSKKDFRNLQRFIDLKKNNELYTPDFVAEQIFKIDTESELKNGEIIKI